MSNLQIGSQEWRLAKWSDGEWRGYSRLMTRCGITAPGRSADRVSIGFYLKFPTEGISEWHLGNNLYNTRANAAAASWAAYDAWALKTEAAWGRYSKNFWRDAYRYCR